MTQALSHRLVSAPQPQELLRHEAPAPHALPHAPQFEGSELVSAQVAPHSASAAGHVQLPFWQWLPRAHTLPQPPQLLESLLVLAQAPLHKLEPAVQAHVPPPHS